MTLGEDVQRYELQEAKHNEEQPDMVGHIHNDMMGTKSNLGGEMTSNRSRSSYD